MPNVVLSRRRHGIEVLHLYTGRTLTQLPLHAHASHADVNGDGTVDHVTGLSSHETHSLIGEAHQHHNMHAGKKGKHKKGHNREVSHRGLSHKYAWLHSHCVRFALSSD